MRQIEFFLFPDAIGLDIVGPLDVFAAANVILDRKNAGHLGYEVNFSGKKTGLVRLSSGLKIYADTPIGKGNPIDIFILPGGLNTSQVTKDSALIDKIYVRAKKAKQIVSVCGGAFILSLFCLLYWKNVTTHWEAADELARLYPDVKVNSDAIFIQDGKIYTSAGVTAGIDLALAIVEGHHGASLAMDIARQLVLYFRRSGGQSQFSAPMALRAKAGKKFSALHDWLFENLNCSLTIDAMAEHMAMSPRNFSRLFSKTTGIPPGKYIEQMRLEYARQLLENSDISVENVAIECGLLREERLRRLFLRRMGVTPSQYRLHFQMASKI